jgi:ribonuclease Z
MMEITFLGTSQAIPTAKRNHTSILLKYCEDSILVDCCEGTQRQMRIAGINPCKLTKLLITHWHGDHILGIPGLLQTLALNNYNRTLEVYGPRGTRRFFEAIMNMFIFHGKIKTEIKEINDDGIFLENDKFSISAYEMDHGAPCIAYSFEEKEKRRVKMDELRKIGIKPSPMIAELQKGKNITYEGKTIKADKYTFLQEGKKITFIMDTALNANCIKIAENADLLISESTYMNDLEKKAYEYKHLTARQAAEIAKRARVKELVLTHLSQRYEEMPEKILHEAQKVFKSTKIAKDFMKLEL